MKTRALTTEEKARIVGMHDGGLRGAKIARELALPQSTVYTVLSNYDKRKTVVSPKSPGRPPKLSVRDKRSLKRLLTQDRRRPLADITNSMTTKVSASTVRTVAHEMGFQARVAAVKPFLNARHVAKRLEFAKAHKNWTLEEWRRVIWTDESTFEVGKNSRQVLVWRTVDEKFNSDCLTPSFKSGRTSVMVWGAFVADRRLPLIVMPPGRRTAVDFVEIVYDAALGPFLEAQDDAATLTLMEDGAPVHRSKVPKAWREARSLKKLEWPANSPDLNPIENVWRIMKDAVQNKHRPKNNEEMKVALEAEWKAIPDEKLESLVASMPDRIKAVLEAKGGSTRW